MALCYALLVALFLVAYARLFAGVGAIVPDSRGYLYFSPDRTIGYQLFLAAIGTVTTSFAAVRTVQLLLVGASVLLAAYALFRRAGSAALGAAAIVLTLGYPAPMKSAVQVTTEGPSMACAALFAAVYLFDARQPRFWALPAYAALLFVAATLRPTNPALLLGALLAVWAQGEPRAWARTGARAAVLVAAVASGMAATPLAARWLSPGRPVDSAAVRGLFGAALLAPGPGDREASACAAPAFDPELNPIKAYLAAAPGPIANYLEVGYTNYMRFDRTIPRIMAESRLRLRAEAIPTMACYARARLWRHPAYLAGRAVRNYWTLVSYRNFDTPSFTRHLAMYLDRHPPPLPAALAFPDRPDEGLRPTAAWPALERLQQRSGPKRVKSPLLPKTPRNPWAARLLSAAMLLSTALGLMALGLLALSAVSRRWLRAPAVMDVAVFAVVIQAVLVASAFFEIPLMRYVYPVWPLVVLVLLRPLGDVWIWWRGRERATDPVPA